MIDKSFIFVLMTKLTTYFIISVFFSVIFSIKAHQTIDKVVKITNYYAEFYILHQYYAQHHCIYTKMYTPFKSNLINNMGHVRISGTAPI